METTDTLPRKEERIASSIPPDLLRIVLVRVEILPHTRRIDVLVLLIPPAIDNFGQGRVVICSLERIDIGQCPDGGGFGGSGYKVVEGFRNLGTFCFGSFGGFGAVLEYTAATGAEALVDNKGVKVIML